MAEKSFTLRLDEATYREIRARAETSVAEFVREAIASYISQKQRDELSKSFECLVADDFDNSALKRAQARVIRGDHD